ncbi:telomere length and silencing protein 1 homolog [Lingula anatina]|uniref:Telomere length and silencing protein 1 homolog n=1 Tax=Lingula anatina TaxID=7574 RepID=A0A1S3HEV9_LINAN|nr:telomere length and silencing protein 1 homolog [Lingula anatina]|eukprot:XP_013384612.1 telomere length and silencing protein 1 homolog [Lingula anatina]
MEENAATFKTKKRKQFRKRKASSESEDDSEKEEESSSNVNDVKLLQNLRKKQHGVSVTSLNLGKKVPKVVDTVSNNDPFNLQTGGMMDMKAIKARRPTTEEIESIGTAFAAETNRRDEDADMLKYVEEELMKRKGVGKDEPQERKASQNPMDALYDVPEHLRVGLWSKNEDMLSNQMLSGIPEVDLGIEAKIKNIEATEEAKAQLLRERMNKKDNVSEFVPTNYAVNFVQHKRFTFEENKPAQKAVKEEAPKPKPVRVGDYNSEDTATDKSGKKKSGDEKATDDFHFERFKKQVLRR